MEECEDPFSSAEFSVHAALEDILTKSSSLIYERYLNSTSLSFSVSSTVTSLLSTIEYYCVRHDAGEPSIWADSIEPAPSTIDTWARGAVPIKKVAKVPKHESSPTVQPNDTKSITSASRRSIYGRLGKSSRTHQFKDSDKIPEAAVPEPIPESLSDKDSQEERLRVKKENATRKKKEESERLKKMQEDEEANDKKVQKDSETVKNKVLTYSCNGKILFVAPVKAEGPSAYTMIKYLTQEIEERKSPSRKKVSQEMQPVKKKRTAPEQETEWVKSLTAAQPPLFESIQMSPGVTLHVGGRSKQCNDGSEEKMMSRKQYAQAYGQNLSHSTQFHRTTERKFSLNSSVDSELRTAEGKKEFLEGIPDLEDVKSMHTAELTASLSPVRSKLNHGRVFRYGASFDAHEMNSPNEIFNADILKNKNWGLNPPLSDPRIIERVPKKASSKELRELYGDIVKKPKDKPFITPKELWEVNASKIKKPRDRPNIERVEKKTRMPPPPYGFTMINALPEISGLMASLSGRSVNDTKH